MRQYFAAVAAVAVLSVAAVSCGDDTSSTESSVSSTTGVPSTTSAATTVTPPATTVAKPTAPPTVAPTTRAPTTAVTSSTAATSTTAAGTPDCSPDAFGGLARAVMGDAFGSVDVDRCQSGFARFFGVPLDPERFESEQFFARWDDGVWLVVDSGTGLTCGDPANLPDLVAACEALGLSS